MKESTAWDKSADWYDNLLKTNGDNYQKKVILPNLLRLLGKSNGQILLDLACGSGFFSREFVKVGFKVVGIDASKNLIEIAKKESAKDINYFVAPANKLTFLKNGSIDKIVIILAIQNIADADGAIRECGRVLRNSGAVLIVMNHPNFRIPKESSWGWDENKKIQFRRIDKYMSEITTEIQMHPGDQPNEYTISFHRPLQYYFKIFNKYGLCVERLEEWISHKKSQKGPRAEAEDRARKEIPLFMFLKLIKA